MLLSILLTLPPGEIPKDLEMDTIQVRYINGYPSLAAFMASDDDKSTSIYRRFDRLSARNLLYLQSELVELEAQQKTLDVKDTADLYAATEEMESVRDWRTLKARANEAGNLREKEQLRIALEIREKIKEYSSVSPPSHHYPG